MKKVSQFFVKKIFFKELLQLNVSVQSIDGGSSCAKAFEFSRNA